VTPMREFANQKALQDHVKLHDLVYLWEGTRPFVMRFAELSPEQCEVVNVRSKRGVTRALLFPKELLRAEWKAAAPPREALAMKRQRLRGRPAVSRLPMAGCPMQLRCGPHARRSTSALPASPVVGAVLVAG
jgi:hypothetical protein